MRVVSELDINLVQMGRPQVTLETPLALRPQGTWNGTPAPIECNAPRSLAADLSRDRQHFLA